MQMDVEALVSRVKAAREAKDMGLNVRFLRADGTPDEFSFADPKRAEGFRANLRRLGRTILS
jgi:hypothetical protein